MLEQWLASVGLTHLAHRFREQDVEFADLPELTDDDLREIGLTVGQRKRFRRALATGVASAISRQRRPLTLAFFDLVDSAALCEELDAEDMVEVLTRYHEFCALAIDHFGGHVAHLLGDGLLAYFCYPMAHENDAERAVRAAMAINQGVRALVTPARRHLAVRSGIATGRVVVTELLSDRAADKHAVTGSAANLAARLQALAEPDGIVVSEATWRHVDAVFDCERLEPQRLKGFVEPIVAYRVRAERTAPRPLEERGSHLLSPFIDRDEERGLMHTLWQRTCEGAGAAVLIHSGPGIGKSRLVGQVLADIGAMPEDVVRLHASSFEEHSPLGPFFSYLRRHIGIDPDAPGTKVAEALRCALPMANQDEVTALTAFLEGRPDMREDGGAAAGERRRLALEAMARHFANEAALRPLLIVVEDAHWLDASSKEAIGRLLSSVPWPPYLLIVTSREPMAKTLPDLDPRSVHELQLGPLQAEQVLAMVRATFGDEPVPHILAERIAARSDGVPLFVEELLRPLVTNAALANWRALIADAAEPGAVPATLSEALVARLDRLGAERRIAEVASVIGRSIDLEVLAHVLGKPADQVACRLGSLVEAGILIREAGADAAVLTFSHALLRDAAYDSILREDRQDLHGRVADALRAMSPKFEQERPEIVAMHLSNSGRNAEALPRWLDAGRLATARSALHEARYALERAAELAATLSQTAEVLEMRLEIASHLGPVLFALCGPGSRESRKVYESAVELAGAIERSGPHFAVLWGWWRLTRDFRVKAERAAGLMQLAEKRREPEMLLQAHHCNWASRFHAGDFAGSREHIRQGLEVYARGDCGDRPWLFGNHDAKVCGHGELAQAMWMEGEVASALAQEAEALAWSARLGHSGTMAHAFDLALLHRVYRRDVAEVSDLAGRLIALADDRSMKETSARGSLFRGWALAVGGDAEAGIALFEGAYRDQRAVGTDEDTPVYLGMYAEILNALGRYDRALQELNEVRSELDRIGVCNWLPEVWRLIGETTILSCGPAETALTAFETAASLAQGQNARMLEIRIAASRLPMLEGPEQECAAAELRALLAAVQQWQGDADLSRAMKALEWAGPADRAVRS